MINFFDFYFPILKYLSDNTLGKTNDCFNYGCNYLKISDEEKSLYYEKSGANIVNNKFRFAVLYLKKSGNIISVKTGIYKITKKGEELYNLNKSGFSNVVIEQINKDVTNKKDKSIKAKEEINVINNQNYQVENLIIDPYENLEQSINKINELLESEILEKLHNVNPYYFEKIVLDLLYKMGYAGDLGEINAKILTSKSNDGGIDGVLNQDRLGLHQIYIQAKRYKENNNIGRETIQLFIGAMASYNAQYGIFVTTSDFNNNAIECIKHTTQKIILINGKKLAKLMVEYNVGASVEKEIYIKKIDLDYFITTQD